MTSAGSSGVLGMALGAIRRASIVKYGFVGFLNVKSTYTVRQMVYGWKEARNSSIHRCVNA